MKCNIAYIKEGRDVRLLSLNFPYLQHFVLIIQIVTCVHEELQY